MVDILAYKPFYRMTIQKDTKAIYIISKRYNNVIQFNQERLYLMYHLLRFGYFDREIINNIYFSLTGKKQLTKKWLQSLIGGRSYPISISDVKLGRKKIYYINHKFAKWLIEEIGDNEEILNDISVTEYENSMHSVVTNGLFGGKPTSINSHDYKTRLLVSDYARLTCERSGMLAKELNLQYSFPRSREITKLLPDATLFLNGYPFYFEYDNRTEPQWKLLSKILRYIVNRPFKNTNVYFIFNVPRLDKLRLSNRIKNFLDNIETNEYNDKTIIEQLIDADIDIYGLPEFQSSDEVVTTILDRLGLLKSTTLTIEKLKSGFPFYVNSIKVDNSDSPFDYFATITDDDFHTYEIPLIKMRYAKSGNRMYLENLKMNFASEYHYIGLLYSRAIVEQFEIINDDFFKVAYIL